MDNRLKLINLATNTDNFCEKIESYVLEEPAPRWWFLLHDGEVSKFLELAKQLKPNTYLDANPINNYFSTGTKVRASLFVLLPPTSVTKEVVPYFDIFDLNVDNNFGLILRGFDHAAFTEIINNCKFPIDLEANAFDTTPLNYMLERGLFTILDILIQFSAKKINLNNFSVRIRGGVATLNEHLSILGKSKTLTAILHLNSNLRNIKNLQKKCPVIANVKIAPSKTPLNKDAKQLRSAIITNDLLAIRHSKACFSEIPLDEHPFFELSANQQKLLVDFFIDYMKIRKEISINFFQWLLESSCHKINALSLTHDHINACLGNHFSTESNDRDSTGRLPIDYYYLSGIICTTKHADVISAKTKFERLTPPFYSQGILYYFEKFPENTPDLQAEIFANHGEIHPVWYELLTTRRISTFIKAAKLQNKLTNLLDANIQKKLPCRHTAALFTMMPSGLITKEIVQYFKPFELNAGQIVNGHLYSNLYHLLYHNAKYEDIVVAIEHRAPGGINFSAGEKSRTVVTQMLQSDRTQLFLKYFSESTSFIDLNSMFNTGSKDGAISIEDFLKVIKKSNYIPRIKAQNKLKFPETSKPAPSKQAHPQQSIQLKTVAPILNQTNKVVTSPSVPAVANNSKESQARKLLESAALAYNLKWEMVIIPDQGCLVTLTGERYKELLPCVEKATKICQLEQQKIEFKASLPAIIRAFKFLPTNDTSQVRSINTEIIFTNEMVKDMEAKIRHAFCQENHLIINWDNVRRRFTINYLTKSWRIQELHAKSNTVIEVNFEDDFVNKHILPNIVEALEEAKDVKAQHDPSNNELVVTPLKDSIAPQAALHQKVFKMATTKKVYVIKAVAANSPPPVAAKVQEVRLAQPNAPTLFAAPCTESTNDIATEENKLIQIFRQLCAKISDTHTNSFEFLNGKFLKKNRKFHIEFSLAARRTINNIVSESLFQAISGAINLQLDQATAIVFIKRNNSCSIIINCNVKEIESIDITRARTYFSATAIRSTIETNLQPASIATYVPADIIHGLNTSDHTFRSIQVFLLRPDSLPICDVRGITFNMMNACISKQDNLARNDANWRNNPWDRTETAEQYFKRKERQLDKILDLLDESQDFMFLQETDILLYPKRVTLKDNEKHLKIQKAFQDKLAAKSWSWCTTHGEGNRALITLYNKKRLKFTGAATSVMEGSALECKFILFVGDTHQLVTLTNIHLKYENNNNRYIDDYQAQQIKNNEFTVLGGDTNLKDAKTSMIFNNDVATNLLAIEKNAKVYVTDRIEDTSVRRDIDTFSAVPTQTTKVRLVESVGEKFVYDDKKQMFSVVQSNPKLDYPDSCTHTSAVGSLCIYTKQNSLAEAAELQTLSRAKKY